MVAVDVKTKRVVATGTQAKQMIGRTPGSIVAVRPLKNGVIADFDMTADMLHSFIFRSDKRSMFSKTRVVISVPSFLFLGWVQVLLHTQHQEQPTSMPTVFTGRLFQNAFIISPFSV